MLKCEKLSSKKLATSDIVINFFERHFTIKTNDKKDYAGTTEPGGLGQKTT